ncbi:Endonuclease/exonuclease/phosphatase [Calycina marina]|uniref:Endonuclease/exonuclease/phosphatase n=1 Tax=Calycina marina TaxID=1763456 RepID=A0A9P7Z3V3_9HELO|nr:Endonuclease/exonuclease/phosphatase [Calycina marina]
MSSVTFTGEKSQVERPPPVSTPHSLSKAVIARRSEYIRPQKIKIKIGSWNVAACSGTDKDLAGWFADGKNIEPNLAGLRVSTAVEENCSQDHIESIEDQEAGRTKKELTILKGDHGTITGGDTIGIYVLGLQEIVDLSSTKEYIGKVYSDTGPMTKWKKALTEAIPEGYQLISEQQLSGLLLLIYASPAVYPTITSVSSVNVGTGIMWSLGNKGAVSTRMVLGETTSLVFVNSHLASGNDAQILERRCWDVSQILQKTRFDPINRSGILDDHQEGIGDEDFAFWFGDLNFRLEGLPGDDIRRLLMLHTQGEYDVGAKTRNKIEAELENNDSPIIIQGVDSDDEEFGSDSLQTSRAFDTNNHPSSDLPNPDDFVQDPSQDPGSLQAAIDSLLPHDQLRHVQKKKRAFHDGWREGPITFLPTYKYEIGTMGRFDSSQKRRAPSWCDRILFRTRKDKAAYEKVNREELMAKRRDEEMKARGIDTAGDDDDVLYDYDPDEDGDETPSKSEEEPTTGKDFYDEQDEEDEEAMTKDGFVDKIHLDIYTSHQRVLSSDHKPLTSVFSLDYDAVVPELRSKIQAEAARELDKAENEGRPGITIVMDHSQNACETSQNVDTPFTAHEEGINLGSVSFMKRKSRSLTIANTSQVTSAFAFVERPGASGDEIGPLWLNVRFISADEEPSAKQNLKEVVLEPGETINCVVEASIDDIGLVQALNNGTMKLDDVLVLRVTEGRDHFVPFHGTWMQTVFGRSIDELIRIPESGIRSLQTSTTSIISTQPIRWSAPRELFKLTELIERLAERVVADASMLNASQVPKESAGWPFESDSWLLQDANVREEYAAAVVDALDSSGNLGSAFPDVTPAIEKLEVVAQTLVLWLGSITDGLVTEALWTKLETDIISRGTRQLTDAEEIKAWVLDVLSSSPNHNIAFVFLSSTLNRVADFLAPLPRTHLSWKKSPPEGSEARVERHRAIEKAYADIFAKVVFRTRDVTGKEKRVAEERKRYILESFLHAGARK